MKLEQYFKLDLTRLIFKYTDAHGAQQEYNQGTVISLLEGAENGEVKVSTIPIENLPLTGLEDIILQLVTHDKIPVVVGINVNMTPPDDWFSKPAFIPLAANTQQILHGCLATLGSWWFEQNTSLDLSEVADNPMFKKGVEAAQEGVKFSNWFLEFADALNINEHLMTERGMSLTTLTRITSGTLVGVSFTVASQAADALAISLDDLVEHMRGAGVLVDIEGVQNDGVQPQTEVSEDASGEGHVPDVPEPLEGKPEGRETVQVSSAAEGDKSS